MSFTKLYLTTKTAPYTPATIRGTWSDTGGAVTKALDTQKVDGGAITTVARAETSASNTFDVLLYRGISGPLAAQTISGNIDVMLSIAEQAIQADFVYHLHVYCTQGDSDTPRGTLLSDYIETTANEWPNATLTGQALASAQAMSSLGVSAGDRIVVEVGFRATNTLTTSLTGTLRYGTLNTILADIGDLTAGSTSASLAGYISFSNSITEVDSTERVSQVQDEVFNTGTKGEIRESQLSLEVWSRITANQRETQFTSEVWMANTVANQRESQFVVEVWSENIVAEDTTLVFVTA